MKQNLKMLRKTVLLLLTAIFTISMALQLLLTISGAGISVLDLYAQTWPKTDKIAIQFDDKYFLSSASYFEKQGKGQCAGFSSAYVLRTLGEEANGSETYEQLGHKFSNGYVMPQALLDLFREYNYRAEIRRGNLEQLKTRLNQGHPIIVLIGHFVSWQHYVTVVGYDQNNIYLYDSNFPADNTLGYNRTMTNAEFSFQWENEIPGFEQIYFVVSSK